MCIRDRWRWLHLTDFVKYLASVVDSWSQETAINYAREDWETELDETKHVLKIVENRFLKQSFLALCGLIYCRNSCMTRAFCSGCVSEMTKGNHWLLNDTFWQSHRFPIKKETLLVTETLTQLTHLICQELNYHSD